MNAALAVSAADLQEAVLEVSLGADEQGEMMVALRGSGGALYLQEQDFAKLRLHLPQTPPTLFEGRRYFAPAAVRGVSVTIDEARQRAVISAPAAAIETTHLSADARRSPPITPSSPGGFLNYQLYGQQVEGQMSGGVSAEFGVFAGVGVLTNTMVGREAAGEDALIRLDTTYTRDFPDQLETLSLGDAISDAGSWGDSVRYAGIRWSRNFGLRPDLLTTPMLSTGGMATVPSTVDVFVNNQLVSSSQTPAGPFIVDRLPAVSGTGDVSVVVRDALGREQVVTQSFYSSTSLLAPGLTQYSVNLGSIRDDYALASDHYSQLLGEGSYRRGITDAFTIEGHAEYLNRNAHAAGLDAAIGIGKVGVLTLTAAGGGDPSGAGWLTGLGVEHRGSRWSLVASDFWASSNFAQVGQPIDPAQRVRERSLLQTGLAFGRFGSLSLAYVRQEYRDSPSQQTFSLTQSASFGRSGTLNLTLTRTLTASSVPYYASASAGLPNQNSTSLYLIYVLPLGGRRAMTASAVGGSGSAAPENAAGVSLTESPPIGPGSGYRLSATTAGDYDADWRQQFPVADLEVEAARNDHVEGRSAYLTGAMTLLDGQLNETRQVNGSFAMVDVAGLANVPVYVENQLTAYTDSTGRALLYNLRPYEANHISISPTELPLDTEISASKEIVAPPYRSGVIARFPIERIRGGTFRLVTDDGKPVPVGAQVKLKGKLFPVVLDGMVYVTGYDHGMAAEASWNGGRCTFRLEPPPSDDPVPDMGTVRCHLAPPTAPAARNR
jgi:outer membrane usher protein